MRKNCRSGITENKLLSICIPTFNRAAYLKNTLSSITGQEKFSESCEIIISDNNSTDNTRDIGEYFSEKYKNIRYYCCETNVGAERNVLKSLNYGQGEYLKLHSDKTCFYETKLTELIESLKNVDHSVIFILNKNKGILECSSFDEFVQTASYWSTWMSGIILRTKEYKNLKNKDGAIGSNLLPTDIMFRILENCNSSLIINEKLLYEQELESIGGYNIFEVFVCNYLTLYRNYLQKGILSRATYKKEKINLLRNFIFPYYTTIVLKKDRRLRFEISKTHTNIFKYYCLEPRLYLYPMYLIKSVFNKLRRILWKNN